MCRLSLCRVQYGSDVCRWLSGSAGRQKMPEPLSHKANKTAWANEAKIALLFCELNSLIATVVGPVLQNIRYAQQSLM